MAQITPRMRAFAREYVLDENPRQAAIRAGYHPKSAAESARQLLPKPHVQALIAKERALRVDPTDLTFGQHLIALAVIRDEARQAGKPVPQLKVALAAEIARGKALGFQPTAGAPKPDEDQRALANRAEVDWHEVITGAKASAPRLDQPAGSRDPNAGSKGRGARLPAGPLGHGRRAASDPRRARGRRHRL